LLYVLSFGQGKIFSISRKRTANCPGDSLQAVIDSAIPGDAISVTGTCNENVVIRNDKRRMALNGGGAAILNGSDPNRATLNIRGKGIVIQDFTISGGSSGIHVNRGANAFIDGSVIQNTDGDGIVVSQQAFAGITNNLIENNPGAGIAVSEGSTARIGFSEDDDVAASPNTIQGNAQGVVVMNGSSARIVGNTISGNDGDGVLVIRRSSADISNNVINNSGGDGIEFGENSVVQLGEDSGSSIFELPNSTNGDNAGFGVRCEHGGVAGGRRGALNGANGPTSFDGSCLNGLL
jgi:nitrous oxidase accessory protein NosD